MRIKLADITTDQTLQIREGMNDATVQEYTERITEGEVFPHILVWSDGGAYMLIDGYHRHAAMTAAGWVDCEVKEFKGTRSEALIAAMLANRNHGLPMNRADKRRAIQRIVDADGEISSRQVAAALGCTHNMVEAVRNSLGKLPTPRRGKDGRMYKPPVKRDAVQDDDKDDGQDAPPEDPGMGGAALSPEACANKGGVTQSEAIDKVDRLIGWASEEGHQSALADLIAVKAYVRRG